MLVRCSKCGEMREEFGRHFCHGVMYVNGMGRLRNHLGETITWEQMEEASRYEKRRAALVWCDCETANR